jgi:transposase
LAHDPDETIIAKAKRCCHGAAELKDADHKLHSRHDKIEIPSIKPIVTRVEGYAGHCPCCHGMTLAPGPEGREEGSISEGALDACSKKPSRALMIRLPPFWPADAQRA